MHMIGCLRPKRIGTNSEIKVEVNDMRKVMGRMVAFATALTIMLSVGAISFKGIHPPTGKGIATMSIRSDDWEEGSSRD